MRVPSCPDVSRGYSYEENNDALSSAECAKIWHTRSIYGSSVPKCVPKCVMLLGNLTHNLCRYMLSQSTITTNICIGELISFREKCLCITDKAVSNGFSPNRVHSKITEIVTGPVTGVVSRKRTTGPVNGLRAP